jgi:hypothetical protein
VLTDTTHLFELLARTRAALLYITDATGCRTAFEKQLLADIWEAFCAADKHAELMGCDDRYGDECRKGR